MPNWCSNVITLSHRDGSMVDRAEGALKRGSFMAEFIPIGDPEDLYEGRLQKWGTKWDAVDANVERVNSNEINATFLTAWSPPIAAYKTLEDMGFRIYARYFEPGNGFCGMYRGGKNDHFEIPHQSQLIRGAIPAELDEEFSIISLMAPLDGGED